MKCFFVIISACLFFISFLAGSAIASQDNIAGLDTGRTLFGNVYGEITETASGSPVNDAHVYVTDQPLVRVSENTDEAVHSNLGWVVIPEENTAVCSVISRDGKYIVNNIPVASHGSTYTVVIETDGARPVVVESALILPGAIMALQVDVRLNKNPDGHVVECGQTSEIVITNNFRHELIQSIKTEFESTGSENILSVDEDEALSLRIYATREGLVGGTTANGHVIKESDHFVALPSTQVLCSKGGHEFQVKLEHNGYTETAPVWDIGPWNIHDNYWASEDERSIYQYLDNGGQTGGLGQGLPESQAAYQDDFNFGRDEYDRQVTNPAGIDLADGTFWDGLNLSDNAWINVKYLWLEGDGTEGESSSSVSCFINTSSR